MSNAQLLLPALDAVAVARFASLCDERVALVAELERGFVLVKPIVSPKGNVVGEELYPNPAASMLRQLDKQLDALCDRLGLVPSARARLGLTLTTVEKQGLEVDALLAARFKEPI